MLFLEFVPPSPCTNGYSGQASGVSLLQGLTAFPEDAEATGLPPPEPHELPAAGNIQYSDHTTLT